MNIRSFNSMRWAFGFVIGAASLSLARPAFTAELDAAAGGEPPLFAQGLLVKFRASATDAELADALQRGGLRILRHLRSDDTVVVASSGLGIMRAIEAIDRHGAVEVVEPNWVYQHQVVSNDPRYTDGSLWGMYGDTSPVSQNTFGSQAAEAWANGNTGSDSVVIGIIDEGVDETHPDLVANLWSNPGEIPNNQIDDDGNGFVDDVRGWDFFHDDASTFDAADGDDHGTHVAGTIGATGGNGAGVVGVNWQVKMVVAKFLGPAGGSTADAVDAVNYLTALKKSGVNLVAINNSWGGGGYSTLLHGAINGAAREGILFVCAAGNSGRNNDRVASYPANYNTTQGPSPASYDAVIAVAALTSSGAKASYSNYGATTVDLGAPGSAILSTVPGGGYASYSGTSMATPHVTGGAGLYSASHPVATAVQIRNALLSSVAPTSSLTKKTSSVATGGRLDVSGF
ncbi:MAG: S8 family serine peptidase [Verrucomicrobiales bacterium]|nr:S8 family serine peptidase [Verrucomicrobiales bacterium]